MNIRRDVAFVGCRLSALNLAVSAAINLAASLVQILMIWPVSFERITDGQILLISSLFKYVIPQLILSVILWRAANWLSLKIAPSAEGGRSTENLFPIMISVIGLWIVVNSLPHTLTSGFLLVLSGPDMPLMRTITLIAIFGPITLGILVMIFSNRLASILQFIQKGQLAEKAHH